MKPPALATVFFLVFISCSASGWSVRQDVGSDESSSLEGPREQLRCGKLWGVIMDEWRKNGGGVGSTIRETRRGCPR